VIKNLADLKIVLRNKFIGDFRNMNENGGLNIFPSQFVYYTKVQNHSQLKERYLSKILEDLEQNKFLYESSKTWKCDVVSSFFGNKTKNLKMFGDDFCDAVVWEPLKLLKEELHQTIPMYDFPKKFMLSEIWYNAYEKDYFQEYHKHGQSNFSGIYLIDLHETNKTVFMQDDLPSIITDKYFLYNTEHIKEGNVIIFPSNLQHCVNSCENNRVTVSFNIKIVQ
jgi:hypothetical protein